MGLFSFLKKAGSSLLKREAEAKEIKESAADSTIRNRIYAIESKVRSLGIMVINLEVLVDGGQVTVYGQTNSKEEKDRAILAVEAMEGVSGVDDRISILVQEPEEQIYEVKSGDSLSKIAKKYYGDPMKYMDIFNANRDILKDPNLIFPGQQLKIPNLD